MTRDQLITAMADEARTRMIAAGTDARLANPGRFTGRKVTEAEAAGAVAGALRVLHNEGYQLVDERGVGQPLDTLADEVEGRIT